MSKDLWEIKQKILTENRVEELLNTMGCQNVRNRSNRFEAQLPDKFHSDNSRSVQVYLTDFLSCRIRSKGISEIDIYGLVSYIIFDCRTEEHLKSNLYKSKKWICELLGYNEFLLGVAPSSKKEDPLKWLNELKKARNKNKLREFGDNRIYPDTIMNQYIMYPYYPYIKQGLEYRTQLNFQVGFDVHTERVIYPIHNQFGDIISIKGRTVDPNYKEKDIYKFMYLYNFNKMIEWYNWHIALYYILEQKEVIIFEGEKSCWWAFQFGFMNCIAISGDDISSHQIKMIKDLGIEIRIVIALDKDKTVDDFKKQGKKFGHARQVYALYDAHGLLSKDDKDSPVDRGSETFLKLYKDSSNYRIT